MKTEIIFKLLICCLLMSRCNCVFSQQKEEILEIKYISIDQNIEISETLVITPDSMYFTESFWKGKEFGKFQDAIPSGLWATLMSKCDIRVFDGIKNHENPEMSSYALRTFHIITTKSEYIFVDDYEDKAYNLLKDFCEIISKQAHYCSTRSSSIETNIIIKGNLLIDIIEEEDELYFFQDWERTPAFPGGDAALYNWLHSNLSYPKDAFENDIEGQVVVDFGVHVDARKKAAKKRNYPDTRNEYC